MMVAKRPKTYSATKISQDREAIDYGSSTIEFASNKVVGDVDAPDNISCEHCRVDGLRLSDVVWVHDSIEKVSSSREILFLQGTVCWAGWRNGRGRRFAKKRKGSQCCQ